MTRACARCARPVEHKHGDLCAACIADDMEPDEEREDDPDQVFLDFVCGMLADGTCMLAGSEDCGWECPRGRD